MNTYVLYVIVQNVPVDVDVHVIAQSGSIEVPHQNLKLTIRTQTPLLLNNTYLFHCDVQSTPNTTAMPPTRRNLFQNHLSRRPASNPPQSSTSDANDTPTDNNDNHNQNRKQNLSHQSNLMTPESRPITTTATIASTDDCDIIARDKNGKFQLDIPVLPPIPLDEGDEEDDVENEGEGAMEGIEEDGRRSGGSEAIGKDKDSEFISTFSLQMVWMRWLTLAKRVGGGFG